MSDDNLGRVSSTLNNLGTFGYYYVGSTKRMDKINFPYNQKTASDHFPATADHRLKNIAKGTLRSLIRASGMTVEHFLSLL